MWQSFLDQITGPNYTFCDKLNRDLIDTAFC